MRCARCAGPAAPIWTRCCWPATTCRCAAPAALRSACTQPPGAGEGCCTLSYSKGDIQQIRRLHAWQMMIWCRAQLSIADRQADGKSDCGGVSQPPDPNTLRWLPVPAGGGVSGLRLAVRRGAADAGRRRAQPPADFSRHSGRLPAPAVSCSSPAHHGQHGLRSCPIVVMGICCTSNGAACSTQTSGHPASARLMRAKRCR